MRAPSLWVSFLLVALVYYTVLLPRTKSRTATRLDLPAPALEEVVWTHEDMEEYRRIHMLREMPHLRSFRQYSSPEQAEADLAYEEAFLRSHNMPVD